MTTDITGKVELPNWWNKPIEERTKDWQDRYKKDEVGYDDYIGQFTYDTRKYTGKWLLRNIRHNSGKDALVLDVGCGVNPFKNKIKNLIGIEPGTWGNPDINIDLEGACNIFQKESFDWVLAIGILHHHDEVTIHKMIQQLKYLTKPGGYIACLCKPYDDDPEKLYHPEFGKPANLYPWFVETTHIFTKEHKLKYYQEPIIDYTDLSLVPNDIEIKDKVVNGRIRERLFWIWEKDTTL